MFKKYFIAVVLGSSLLYSCEPSVKPSHADMYVRGNCDMCKERIEQTVLSIPGVQKAVWDVSTKQLSVDYDSTKIAEMNLHKAVANVGHSTKQVEATEASDAALPECCRKNGI